MTISTRLAARVLADAPAIIPGEAYRRAHKYPDPLLMDVRATHNARATGTIPGALSIPLGTLAARTVDDPRLRDRSRPIIVTCQVGYNAARAARLLKALGYSDVSYVEGGMRAWLEAGLPTTRPDESIQDINR
jgi:rhodanese-related sulfurtransferase